MEEAQITIKVETENSPVVPSRPLRTPRNRSSPDWGSAPAFSSMTSKPLISRILERLSHILINSKKGRIDSKEKKAICAA